MEKIKLLLYCTKQPLYLVRNECDGYFYTMDKGTLNDYKNVETYNGKIVAECDFEVEEITTSTWNAETERRILKGSCLKEHQLFKYIIKGDENESQNPFYAIHIKNLNIFDKSRELNEFTNGKGYRINNAPQNMMYAYKYLYTCSWSDNTEKYILISIRPEWLVKILNGEKTIEVRKKVLKEMIS